MNLMNSRPGLRLWIICSLVALSLSCVTFLVPLGSFSLDGVVEFFAIPSLFLAALVFGCGVHGGCSEVVFVPLVLLLSTLFWGALFTILTKLVLDMKGERTGPSRGAA